MRNNSNARLRKCLLSLGLCLLISISASAVRGQSPQQWPVNLTVGPFEIHSDFELLDKATLTQQLSSVSADVQRLLKIEPNRQQVHVVLFETATEYRRYMQNYFPGLPARRALFIQDRGPGMLFAHWHAKIATDLRHEVTHALVNNASGELPLWIDEGIAEYFEVASEARFRGNDHLTEVANRAALGFVPKLDSLASIRSLEQFSNAHYRDSWSWMHYLVHRRDSTRQLLLRYIADSRSGAKPLPLEQQLQRTVPDIEQDYREHFSYFAHQPPAQRIVNLSTDSTSPR